MLNSVFLDRKCRACDCEARNASEPLLPKSMEAGRRPRGLPAPGALQPATCTDSLPRRAVCRLRGSTGMETSFLSRERAQSRHWLRPPGMHKRQAPPCWVLYDTLQQRSTKCVDCLFWAFHFAASRYSGTRPRSLDTTRYDYKAPHKPLPTLHAEMQAGMDLARAAGMLMTNVFSLLRVFVACQTSAR